MHLLNITVTRNDIFSGVLEADTKNLTLRNNRAMGIRILLNFDQKFRTLAKKKAKEKLYMRAVIQRKAAKGHESSKIAIVMCLI
jgi:hypothetical protein